MRKLIYEAISQAMKDLPVTTGPIERKENVDIDRTEVKRRRKIIEWTYKNVHDIKSVPAGKGKDIRETIADAINKGTNHKLLTKELMKKYDLTEVQAVRIAMNSIRSAYNWSFRRTAYENGFRNVVWHTHPGACKTCRALNGITFLLTQISIPESSHINCRCFFKRSNKGFVSPISE